MKKFIALYDIHCGYELRLIQGRRVKTETHSPSALAAVLDFARDFGPDTIILGGDQLDIASISDHNNGKPRLVEGLRLTDDYDALNNLVIKPLGETWADKSTKIWLTGNHENRVRRYLDAHPGSEGLIEPEGYLRLRERGWHLQEEEVPYAIGKLNFVHGHAAFPRGGCADAAKKLVSRYRKSVVCGHLHTYSVATDVTPADASDYHTGTICPALGVVNPGYRLNAPGNENLGFAWGYVLDDGNFTLYISLLADGKFTANGKTYGGEASPKPSPSALYQMTQQRDQEKFSRYLQELSDARQNIYNQQMQVQQQFYTDGAKVPDVVIRKHERELALRKNQDVEAARAAFEAVAPRPPSISYLMVKLSWGHGRAKRAFETLLEKGYITASLQ